MENLLYEAKSCNQSVASLHIIKATYLCFAETVLDPKFLAKNCVSPEDMIFHQKVQL